MHGEKGAISSPEDDSSVDESPSGDGRTVSVELPVDDSLPKWWMFSRRTKSRWGRGQGFASLACRLTRMSLGLEPEVPAIGPVDTPGLLSSTLARGPPKSGYRRTVYRNQADSSDGGKEGNESEDEANPRPPGQGPAPPPGGGNGDPPQDGDEDNEEEDSKSSDSEMGEAEDGLPEDPDNAGTGKFYKPQTPNGKAMAKMFCRFCDLAEQDACAIVVYFGVYSVPRLAAFHQIGRAHV